MDRLTGQDWFDIAYYGAIYGTASLVLLLFLRSVIKGWLTVYREEQAQIERDKESDRKRRQDKHFSQSGGKFLQHPYPEHRQRAS